MILISYQQVLMKTRRNQILNLPKNLTPLSPTNNNKRTINLNQLLKNYQNQMESMNNSTMTIFKMISQISKTKNKNKKKRRRKDRVKRRSQKERVKRRRRKRKTNQQRRQNLSLKTTNKNRGRSRNSKMEINLS